MSSRVATVAVVGLGRLAEVLRVQLQTVGVSVVSVQSVDVQPGNANASLDQLQKAEAVLAVAPASAPSNWTLQLVHRLRTDLTWEGTLVALMPTQDAKGELDDCPLDGGREDFLKFHKVHGHASLARPSSLPEILALLSSQPPMYYRHWLELCEAGQTSRILASFQRSRNAYRMPVSREASADLARTIQHLGELDWRMLLLNPHRDLDKANELLALSRLEARSSLPNLTSILDRIDALLGLTWIANKNANQ